MIYEGWLPVGAAEGNAAPESHMTHYIGLKGTVHKTPPLMESQVKVILPQNISAAFFKMK